MGRRAKEQNNSQRTKYLLIFRGELGVVNLNPENRRALYRIKPERLSEFLE